MLYDHHVNNMVKPSKCHQTHRPGENKPQNNHCSQFTDKSQVNSEKLRRKHLLNLLNISLV